MCCGFFQAGCRPSERRQYPRSLLWNLGVNSLILYRRPRLLGQGDSRSVINATAYREEWRGCNAQILHSNLDLIIGYPDRELERIASVRWMARSVPQIGHDWYLPNLWLTHSHRIPNCITSTVGTARSNSFNHEKATHNVHDELPQKSTGYGPSVHPLLHSWATCQPND